MASALALAVVIALAACGSSSSSSTSSSAAASSSKTTSSSTTSNGTTATVVIGTFPQSLDPSIDFTTQGGEAHLDQLSGPLHLRPQDGHGGRRRHPRARGSAAGRQQRRQDLHHDAAREPSCTPTARRSRRATSRTRSSARSSSRGVATASTAATIVGALAYSKGTAKSISGIVANDATGTITIHLLAPYGAFLNVLAFPSSGFVPSGDAAMTNLSLTTLRPASARTTSSTSCPTSRGVRRDLQPVLCQGSDPGDPPGQRHD